MQVILYIFFNSAMAIVRASAVLPKVIGEITQYMRNAEYEKAGTIRFN